MSGDDLARVVAQMVKRCPTNAALYSSTRPDDSACYDDAADLLESTAARLAEADAVIAHMYGDFPRPGERREPHRDWRRHEAEAIERHHARAEEQER